MVCEKSRILHCLGNRLKDGGEIVNLARRQRSTPQKYFYLSVVLISVRS
jgi:hypothetical protein